MKIFRHAVELLLCITIFNSCAAPIYERPNIQKNYVSNKGTFSIQNMDATAKIESQSLISHYAGFDVRYKVLENLVVSFEIINNTNKSLIIDKSKCYVLYNGYSVDLFKDVRSSRSTTFNNVQDAINNVQTSDASVTMTIPPYSKWELPLGESNVRAIKELPKHIDQLGPHPLQPYDNPEPVEFVIPYTFDYSLAKWATARNRVYVGQIDVEKTADYTPEEPKMSSYNHYSFGKVVYENFSNKSEVDLVNERNIRAWKSHRHKVNTSHIIWGIITIYPLLGAPIWWDALMGGDSHPKPTIYNSDGTSAGEYNKHYNYKAKY